MPKIPVYRQQVEMAAGPLGPRAGAGLEAPGQALSSFGKQVGDIAYQFGMAEKQAEADRVYRESMATYGAQADSLVNNSKSNTVNGFEIEAGAFRKEVLASVDARKELTNNQKEAIKAKLGGVIDRKISAGRGNVFNRQQKQRSKDTNEALNYLINEGAANPASIKATMNDIESIMIDAQAQGLDVNMDMNDVSLEIENRGFGLKILGDEQASNPSGLLATIENINNSNLSREAKAKRLSEARGALSRVRTIVEDQIVGQINQADGTRQDFENASENLLAGKAATFTVNGKQVTVDPQTAGLTNKNIEALATKLSKRANDIEDVVSDNLVYELNTGFDIQAGVSGNVSSVAEMYSPERMATHGKDAEDLDDLSVVYADQLESGVSDMLTSGEASGDDFSELMLRLNTAESILNEQLGGRTPLATRVGAEGDNARKTLSRIATAKGKLNKMAQSDAEFATLVNVISNGDYEYIKDQANPEQTKKAVDGLMAKHADNIPKQISILANNNVKYERYSNILEANGKQLNNPNFDPEGADATEVFAAVELYREMKLFGPSVVNNHVTGDAKKNLEAALLLESHYDLAGAVKIMQRQREDIDVEASYKLVKESVESISDEASATYSWYEYIPGLGRDEEFSVADKSAITSYVSRLTKEYIRLGVEADKAVELAAKDYGSTHRRVRNIMVPITKDLPENIEELATSAVQGAMLRHPELSDLYESDDLSIANIQGTNDRWTLVYDGGYPVQLMDGQIVEFSMDDLNVFMVNQKADEGLIREAKRTEINFVNKVETDYRLGRGEFEGLSPYEKKLLRLRKLKPHRSFRIDISDIKEAMKTSANEFKETPRAVTQSSMSRMMQPSGFSITGDVDVGEQ